jgi:hypothetical protein
MLQSELVIKKEKWKPVGILLLIAGLIIYYFIGPYENTRILYKNSPVFTTILGIISFIFLFSCLAEIVNRKAEIILTQEGIGLRGKGFFSWDMIDSFETIYYSRSENNDEELILYFKEFSDIKFIIKGLEKNRAEVAGLILKYKGAKELLYLGDKQD